jgi:hypothetical protein
MKYWNVILRGKVARYEDDAWYEAIADALRIIGKRWDSDVTDEEDAFILAYADEVAERPASERDLRDIRSRSAPRPPGAVGIPA